jgi:hypothetical protein
MLRPAYFRPFLFCAITNPLVVGSSSTLSNSCSSLYSAVPRLFSRRPEAVTLSSRDASDGKCRH